MAQEARIRGLVTPFRLEVLFPSEERHAYSKRSLKYYITIINSAKSYKQHQTPFVTATGVVEHTKIMKRIYRTVLKTPNKNVTRGMRWLTSIMKVEFGDTKSSHRVMHFFYFFKSYISNAVIIASSRWCPSFNRAPPTTRATTLSTRSTNGLANTSRRRVLTHL